MKQNKEDEPQQSEETGSSSDPEGQKENLRIIRRRLYARQEPKMITKWKKDLKNIGIKKQAEGRFEEKGDTLSDTSYKNLTLIKAKRLGRVVRFSGILFFLLFIFILAVVATAWYRSSQEVRDEQVVLEVSAPGEFVSGGEIEYKLSYRNDSKVRWQDIEIVFSLSRGFIWKENSEGIERTGRQFTARVDGLDSGQSGEFIIKGQLIGEQNETAVAKAEIFITPENFVGGRFSKVTSLATTITALPLEVAFDIPKDAASGERVLATIDVRSLSNFALEGVYLRLLPAEGIQLAVDDEEFSKGFSSLSSEWQIGTLPSLEEKQFKVVFYVEGQPDEKRIIGIEAGIKQDDEEFTQRELTHVVSVSRTELIVDQLYKESSGLVIIDAGERVRGEVYYKNIGNVGLKDVIVEVEFEGVGFKPETLSSNGGAYDSATKTMMWSAATVPELLVVQPQEEGKISFEYSVMSIDEFIKEGGDVKNQIIISRATVDSPDLPAPVGQPRRVVSDRVVLSVRTEPIFEVGALYDDGRLGLTSSGPKPPRVGETTTYTVRFRVGTTLNDVSDVHVMAVLPDGVDYAGQHYMTNGELQFNDRTGQLDWKLPFVEGATGKLRPPEELHVQVAITPGDNLRGSAVSFLNKASLRVVDQFTEEALSQSLRDFPNTGSVGEDTGVVQ
jgi:hypothetical protein